MIDVLSTLCLAVSLTNVLSYRIATNSNSRPAQPFSFKNDRALFSKLAAQCAQLTSSEPILFDKQMSHLISFSPINDHEFSQIHKIMKVDTV
jgi:hypothetical protein